MAESLSMEDDHDQKTVRAFAGGRSHGPACNPSPGKRWHRGHTARPDSQANGGALQLPPIPYLDTLRWLNTGGRGSKVDTLIGPKLDTLGPFLVEPGNPITGLLAAARRDRSLGDALTLQRHSRRIATEQHTG